MNHKHLTDDDVAQLPLAGARAVLLEEIMATPTLAPVRTPKAPRRVRTALASLGAAGAVAAVITATFVVTDDARTEKDAEVLYPASAVAAAERNPRLALDMAGWKITEVAGFANSSGYVTYSDGPRMIELTWYDTSGYASFLEERTIESVEPVQPIQVAGHDGVLVTYTNEGDFEAVLEPGGDSFVGIRTQTPTDPQAWDGVRQVKEVLAHVRAVSVDEWLARMPASVVSPVNAAAAVSAGLKGVPLAPGTDVEHYARLVGVNAEDNFHHRLAGEVICAWVDAWTRARDVGDEGAAEASISAVEGAGSWPVVKAMGPANFMGLVDWVLRDLRDGRDPFKDSDHFGCV